MTGLPDIDSLFYLPNEDAQRSCYLSQPPELSC